MSGVGLHGAHAARLQHAWPNEGREVLVSNTDLGQLDRFVDVRDLRVTRGPHELRPVVPPDNGVLEWGQSLLFVDPFTTEGPQFAPPPAVHGFLARYLEGGPPLTQTPGRVLEFVDAWGLSPDEIVTSTTGSGRQFARRVPGALANLLAVHYGLTNRVRLAAGERHVAEQLLRGDGAQSGDQLTGEALWTSRGSPWVCHQGYTKSATARGSFHPLYSSPMPPGMTWEGSGRQVCDTLHLAVDQCALMAALAGSWAAGWAAFRAVEANVSLHRAGGHGGDAGLRGIARLLHSLAVAYEPCRAVGLPVEHWLDDYLPWLLDVLEGRNVHVPRGSWPGLDYGSGTDGGHLQPEHLHSADRGLIEALGWSAKDATRSACPWMACQVALACDDLQQLVDLPPALRARVARQQRIAAHFATFQGQAPAYDVKRREVRAPLLCWDDVAPGQRGAWHTEIVDGVSREVFDPDGHKLPALLAMGGDHETSWQWSRGVGCRFAVPGLVRSAARFEGEPGAGEARGLARRILDRAGGHLNGDDPLRWQLEAWVPLPDGGWVA